MLLVLHIIVAISGLAMAGMSNFRPSQRNINSAFALTIATFLSGTLLVLVSQVNILKTCLVGLAYVSLALTLTLKAKNNISA